MKVFYHADCLLHNPPFEILGKEVPYLETPSRLSIIQKALSEKPGNFEISDELDNNIDLREWILKIHESEYLDYLETAYDTWVSDGGDETAVFPEAFPHISLLPKKPYNPRELSSIARAGLYCFDLSSPITKDTYKSVLAALRVTLTAANEVRSLAAGEGVFALCRPPGHHAMPSLCGGYCFINNVAVAARFLQMATFQHSPTKLAILDIDYHHGKGTQEAFYTDSSVLYVSLHGENDYPCRLLLRGTTGDDEYCAALEHATTTIQSFDPAYLLVSLGVDTHIEDPICDFNITIEGYLRIGKVISNIQKPTLFVLEGGYDLESIGLNVRNVLDGFQGKNSLWDFFFFQYG
ncbi:Arginase/deacetylase [Phellopilus nigrolimitatus]|nr:Arginase/deacetylase [Phellopilus nigrolimitatus]